MKTSPFASPIEVPIDREMLDAIAPTPVFPIQGAVIFPDIDGLTFVRIGIAAGYCAMCGEHSVEHGDSIGNGPLVCQSPRSRLGDRFVRDGSLDRWVVYNPFMRAAAVPRFESLRQARAWAIVYLCGSCRVWLGSGETAVHGYRTREWSQR